MLSLISAAADAPLILRASVDLHQISVDGLDLGACLRVDEPPEHVGPGA
jgi:hypothetical protein